VFEKWEKIKREVEKNIASCVSYGFLFFLITGRKKDKTQTTKNFDLALQLAHSC